MPRRLTGAAFDEMLKRYRPSSYEAFGQDDARFVRPMHHALKCRDRLFIALRSGLRRLSVSPPCILDFGPYPGSLLRLLRDLDGSKGCRLLGAGLMISEDFRQFMKDDCGAEIMTVNLDPAAQQFRAKAYPSAVPLPEHSVHLAFALEIIEHLTSPFHLLSEAFRLLAPGGHLVITTPNVTRIGNVFKLLIGRSPNDRLGPPGYDNPDDEWRPHVREYAMHELEEMLAQTGFEIAERRFFLGEDTQACRQPFEQQLIDACKIPFYAIPHLRGSLLIVGKKL